MAIVNASIQHLTDTASNFTTTNPILLVGQHGIESDGLLTAPKFKIGDGVTAWNSLPYATSYLGYTPANDSLSNLATTSINANLTPQSDQTLDVGQNGTVWSNGFFNEVKFDSNANIDVKNRILRNSTGDRVFDYENSLIYDKFNAGLSIDADSHKLIGTNGSDALDYSNNSNVSVPVDFTAGSGIYCDAARPNSVQLQGTNGIGFVEYQNQNSTVGAPSITGWRQYSSNVGAISFKNASNRILSLNTSAMTGDVDLSVGNTTGTIATTGYADSKVQNSLSASTTIAPSATAVNTALSGKQATLGYTPANKAGDTFTGAISATNLSGTNTGDQTITLTGNVTGSGTGSFATTIGTGVVTNAMLAGSITVSKLAGAIATNTLYGTDYGIVADGVTDNTTAFNSFMAACKAGQYKGELPKGVIVFLSKPNDIDFPWDLRGHGLNSTILIRKYDEATPEKGLVNVVGASGVTICDMAIESALGQTGGCMVSVTSTSSFASSGITLENLWLSTFGSNTQVYTLYFDGSSKTSAPAGVRDVSLKNVHVFGSTSYSVVLKSVIGFSWFGGGVYPAGGSTSLTGGFQISGITSVKSQFVNINIVTCGGLNLTNCLNVSLTSATIGAISGVSVNNDTTCSLTSIQGSLSGTLLTNWLNSFCNDIGNRLSATKIDGLTVASSKDLLVESGKVKIGTTNPSFTSGYSVVDASTSFDYYAQRTSATSYVGVGLQAGTNLFQIYSNAQSTSGNFQTSTVPVANLNQFVSGNYNNNFSLHGSNIYFFTSLSASTVASSVTSGGCLFGYIANMGTSATALVDIIGSTTSKSSLRLRSGTAPTSPNDGDIWYDGTDLKMRVGSTTKTFTLI